MSRVPHPRDWKLSAWLLVGANLTPIYGIFALGWSAGPLLWFYWLESLVIGGFTVLRMALAPASSSPAALKLFLIPFFAVHYGMFCFVHGVFLGLITNRGPEFSSKMFDLTAIMQIPGLAWMLLALVLSHFWSFVAHYLRGGERERATVQMEMVRPYGRVLVMHLTVMLGGAALIFLDAPLVAALGLLSLKTVVDLRAHFRSHAALGAQPDASII
ncbi:MAG: DUF6498-containing protein [Planctomycetota bacterium]|nr:DUF6498-containing protein [Planctomycetota bacterium]